MTRNPDWTREQLGLLARLLGLSGATRRAAEYVLIDGTRQVDAAGLTGVAQSHISRALASCRRLDEEIRKAYPVAVAPVDTRNRRG